MDKDPASPKAEAATIGASSAVGLGSASLLSAVVGYVVLLIAARILDQESNAIFLTFWSFLFLLFGILGGIQTETTRSANQGRTTAPSPRNPRMGCVALSIGTGTAVILALSAPWWGSLIFGSYSGLVIVVCVAAVVYSGHVALMGSLAGQQRWGTYSKLILSESVLRLAGVILVVLLGTSVLGLAWGAAVGAAAWLFFVLFSKSSRQSFLRRADRGTGAYYKTVGYACLAGAANAALVVGYPILLRVSTPDAEYLASAALLMALSLTRAPLLIPLNAYQGVAITHFVSRRTRGIRAIFPILGTVLGVSVLGAALAWLIGPFLMTTVLGPSYEMSGMVLAALTFDAGLLGLLTITGALAIASGRHMAFSVGWVAATAVSLGLLWLPLDIQTKTVLSLAAGPLVGVLLHSLFIAWSVGHNKEANGLRVSEDN
ncbi:hypothetical protein ITX31_06000 [Arthrobacter gandavensis]|uniref:lipopolysaccharide biosynthesis protein n=1 Tax=Arthrobacter gandavensis TaxID=169960 RepID=UPI00188EEFC9|nr:hypothetical protein [Arthrobacter gandavensis]MBF4993659.1 hypothetical protein [Arthrobacter gandavensis]